MAETSLILLLLALVGFALYLLRRPDVGPAAVWALAWIDLFATHALVEASVDLHWVSPPGYVLGSLFPALILAGAVSYARRPVPSWLLPGALLIGLARAGLVEAGALDLANVVSLLVEPPTVLAAAWLALGEARRPLSSAAQRLLPVAFVMLALLEAATAISWIRLGLPSTMIMAGWILLGPVALGSQILALSERSRAELRRARDELERRVEERTRQLRESEERFRRLVTVSFEGIVVHDRGTILEVNPALEALFGGQARELIGSPLVRLFVPEERERMKSRIDEGLEGVFEVRALRRDGSTFPMEMEAREALYGGRSLCVCGVRDVTERRREAEERQRLERHMQEVQRLESLGVLAGGIAHDFNNMLAVMLGNCRLALQDLEPGSPARERLLRARSAGEQAAGLVEHMLTYSGKPSDSRMPLDLSRLVAELLDLLRASVSEKCTIEPDLEASLPRVDGDPSQVCQVILNLVMNASEAMTEGAGTVAIRTGTVDAEAADLLGSFGAADLPAGKYVFLEVSDQGVGMSASVRQRVFDPFFTTKLSGRGLGLASVLGIVRSHGGTVEVASELGVGSSFRVLLPCRPGSQ
jgi:PAS domain S-box-containing protein